MPTSMYPCETSKPYDCEPALPVTQDNGPGNIWIYRQYPVALPEGQTFAITLDFGSTEQKVEPIAVKVALLGYYKTTVEV